LSELRAAGPTVVVDGGNALLVREAKPGRPGWDQEVVKAEIVAEGYAAGGIDAMAVGDRDWDLGLPKVLALRDAYGLPILAANLSCGGKRPFPASKMVEVGGRRVGIVGFTSGEVPGCVVEPIEEAGPRAAAEVAGADVIVALAPFDTLTTSTLVRLAPDIDLVVDGVTGRREDTPEDVGAAWWLLPGFRGQTLGIATVKFGEGPWTGPPEWTVRMMSDEVADHAATAAIVAAGKVRIAAAEAPIPPVLGPRVVAEGAYAGSDTCKGCHAAQHEQWSGTGHARGWASLEGSGRSLDRQCVGCHVTGWAVEGGPQAPSEAGPLRDVQCEACHGPARAHVATPTVDLVRDPPLTVCVGCHDGVQDQGQFDEAAYRPLVRH